MGLGRPHLGPLGCIHGSDLTCPLGSREAAWYLFRWWSHRMRHTVKCSRVFSVFAKTGLASTSSLVWETEAQVKSPVRGGPLSLLQALGALEFTRW